MKRKNVYRTELTPLSFLERSAYVFPDKVAVIHGARRYSYRQHQERVHRLASALRAAGLAKHDRVAFLCPNIPAMLEAHYGVPAAGGILVAINIRLSTDEIGYILKHSGSKFLFVDAEFESVVKPLDLTGLRVVRVDDTGAPGDPYEDFLATGSPAPVESWLEDEEETISINYTSGTTGRPKGVMYSHRGAWVNAVGEVIESGMSFDTRYLWTLPMFHANGWTFVWIVTAVGACHVCLRKVEPTAVFETMEHEAISMFCAAPTVLISIANGPEELRQKARGGVRLLTAGAPPAAATIERIEGELGWTVTQVYGLTETSPFITVCEPRPEHQRDSLGERAAIKARQGVELVTSGELRVVDAEGNEVANDGESQGEIVVRGNVVMEGYYRDPEATAQVMRGGWFHSGDAAVVHPDGYIEIRDRLKDVIISGGENISSVEVEGTLLRHEAVQEVAVVGLPHELWGEVPHAFVVLKACAAATGEDLRQFARDRLAHFKAPHGVTFLGELPKTATGKVQKYVLRKSAVNPTASKSERRGSS